MLRTATVALAALISAVVSDQASAKEFNLSVTGTYANGSEFGGGLLVPSLGTAGTWQLTAVLNENGVKAGSGHFSIGPYDFAITPNVSEFGIAFGGPDFTSLLQPLADERCAVTFDCNYIYVTPLTNDGFIQLQTPNETPFSWGNLTDFDSLVEQYGAVAPPSPYGYSPWQQYTSYLEVYNFFHFTNGHGADELYFAAGDASLHAIAATAVPEPDSWALMIGGFGLVGGAMRRRKIANLLASYG